jgi:DNA-directed RNA polymerase subunit omega
MLDPLKDESIVNRVGGRFKLSTLMQKRLVQLNKGARPLIATELKDNAAIVLEEIRQEKITLDTSNEVKLVTGDIGTGESLDVDLGDL